jgi:hypothetical protein
MPNAPIVQRARDRHHQIGQSSFGIAEDVFDNATTLDTGQGMFNPDARARNASIAPLVSARQLRLAGLFFGCCVCRTRGS